MANPKVQARFSGELYEHMSTWAGERGIQGSEALRRLTERGLDAEQAGSVAHRAESVVLVFAVGAAVLAPLSAPFPALRPWALAYIGLAAVVFVARLWAPGARPWNHPRPWRRSA